jgi:P-type Ca2+ transporter type 2C
MAAASLRCIAFAYRPFDLEAVPKNENRDNWVLPEEKLILLGIVGIKVCMQILMVLSLLFYLSLTFCLISFLFFLQDPCRPGVKDAVQLCTSAGVKVLFNSKVTSVCACAYMYG